MLPVGVLVGHTVGYGVAPPDPEAIAASGGHGYLDAATALATPLLILAMVMALLSGFRRARCSAPSVGRLFTLQAVAFVALEQSERLAAGANATAAVAEPAVWWGLAAQLVVAAAAVMILRVLHRTGRLLAGKPRPSPVRAPIELSFCRDGWLPRSLRTSVSLRAPPHLQAQ